MCAAVISEERGQTKAILAVNDTRFSWGNMSMDSGWKMQTVHRRWRVMFAGAVSPITALIDAIKTEVSNAKITPYRAFARQCAKAYREERKRLIESEILEELDIHSYAEYEALKDTATGNPLYEKVREQIKKAEEEWNLLFTGFDDVGKPHIFVIAEHGKIQWCDLYAFAAIGSGAWLAHESLARFGYNRFMARDEAVYGLVTAKFASEAADGVGRKHTGFMILKASDPLGRTVPGLNPTDIKVLRDDWEALPRHSPTILPLVSKMLAESQRQRQHKIENPLRGYIKRSTSQKSKRGK